MQLFLAHQDEVEGGFLCYTLRFLKPVKNLRADAISYLSFHWFYQTWTDDVSCDTEARMYK